MELYNQCNQWISDNIPSIIALAIIILLSSFLITSHRKINKKNKIISKCRKLFNNGLYKKTIKYCISVIEKDKDPIIYHYLGLAYFKIDEIHLAIESFKKAEELSKGLKSIFNLNIEYPNYAIFYEDFGDVLRSAKRFDEAISYYKKAIKMRDEYEHDCIANLFQKIAELYEIKGNLNEAIDYYEEALIHLNVSKRSPAYKNVARKLAKLYEKQGDTKMADKIKKEIGEEVIIEEREEERKEEEKKPTLTANNPIL
jgi:tetratricopeptide (TPR) repeat protein